MADIWIVGLRGEEVEGGGSKPVPQKLQKGLFEVPHLYLKSVYG